MNIKQLERAKGLYESIKKLDAEIIDIEKMANIFADKKTDIKIIFKVNDMEEKEREQEKVQFDADGSLVHGTLYNPYASMFPNMFSVMLGQKEPAKKEYTVKKDYTVADTVALQILGVILQQKLEERETLIKAINKIGIEI